MKVLVACEFSGIVRDAFKAKGHDAWSCDLLPTERPGQHIQGDVLDVLDDGWDLMIAHPPCTYLCRNNARCLKEGKEHLYQESLAFFLKFRDAPIPKIAVENPVLHKQALKDVGKWSQTIQPWQFGHDHCKRTCLWLKNLPLLNSTKIIKYTHYTTPKGKRYTRGYYFTPRNWRARSRTFQGIADAFAEQWGE